MVTMGAIYESEHSGDLIEVVETSDASANGDPDNKSVEFVSIETDEWMSVFADNFRKGYDFVADSRDDL